MSDFAEVNGDPRHWAVRRVPHGTAQIEACALGGGGGGRAGGGVLGFALCFRPSGPMKLKPQATLTFSVAPVSTVSRFCIPNVFSNSHKFKMFIFDNDNLFLRLDCAWPGPVEKDCFSMMKATLASKRRRKERRRRRDVSLSAMHLKTSTDKYLIHSQ